MSHFLDIFNSPIQIKIYRRECWRFISIGMESCKRSTIAPFQLKLFPSVEILQVRGYFYGKCSDDLHYLVPPVQIITTKTRHDISRWLNQPHLLRVQNLKRMFYSYSFSEELLLTCELLWKLQSFRLSDNSQCLSILILIITTSDQLHIYSYHTYH